MQKEIDFRLFDENFKPSSLAESPNQAVTEQFLDNDRKIHEMRQSIAQMAQEFAKLSAHVDEHMKSSHLKFERMHQQLIRLEQHHNGLAQDSAQKWTQVSLRMNERKSIDLKINEMVERHSQVVKTFEVRMMNLQKMLQEKEAQLLSAQSAINEARMEISRYNMGMGQRS
jgi:exonuclease VII large subunit